MAEIERVSACLITKNEAANLPGCLSSLRGRVDEVVLIDTGSDDETVQIAAASDCVVGHYPWNGDFAAARNCGLDQATGDWILYIDADERLDELDAPLGSLMPGRQACAARLRLKPSVGATDYAELRLFRRDPRIRFSSMIHERVHEAVHAVCEEDGRQISDRFNVRLLHFGYEGDLTRKHQRNLPLLRKAIELHPDRAYIWFHLGITLAAMGEDAEGVIALNKAIDIAKATN